MYTLRWFAFTLACSIAFNAQGQESFAGGQDVVHSRTPYIEYRSSESWYSWYAGANNQGPRIGADFVGRKDNTFLALGGTLARPDSIVGTSLRYELRLGYILSKHYSLEIIHESNCKSICRTVPGMATIPHGGNATNSGYNYFVIRWVL